MQNIFYSLVWLKHLKFDKKILKVLWKYNNNPKEPKIYNLLVTIIDKFLKPEWPEWFPKPPEYIIRPSSTIIIMYWSHNWFNVVIIEKLHCSSHGCIKRKHKTGVYYVYILTVSRNSEARENHRFFGIERSICSELCNLSLLQNTAILVQ